MSKRSFYESCDMLRPWLHRKSAYAFGVSRASISSTIIRGSHAVATFLGPQLTKLPKTEMEVKELVNQFLVIHGFLQCIGAIDSTHVEIKEPN